MNVAVSPSRRTGKVLSCGLCGTLVYVQPSRQSRFRFCSAQCSVQAVGSGEQHYKWKGGTSIDVHGYRLVRVDRKQVKEHRHVMEQHLGRKLSPREVIHHVNGDPLDNRIENLMVMTQADHVREHSLSKRGKWAKKHEKCLDCGTKEKPHEARGRCKRCYQAKVWEG